MENIKKAVKAEVIADSKDAYNRGVKWILIPAIAYYLVNAFFLTQHKDETLGDGTKVSMSRDTGLKMFMLDFPPSSLLSLHSVAAAALFLLVALQKHTVNKMKDDKDYPTYSAIHRNVGYLCLMVMPIMAIGGYLLGGYSSFANFSSFSVFFAAPFIFWTFSIYYTAQKYSSTMISVHRLLGNMFLKGCVAVPLARVFGSILQARGDWDDEVAFYTGIKAASLLTAIWELTEMYFWYRRFRSLRSHVKQASQDKQFDANAYIDQKIKANKVMVFSKSYCIYCHRVKTLFEELNVPFESIELDLWEHGPIVHQELIQRTKLKTVPNVFVGGKHVGGCDATHEACKNGKLKTMLLEAGITTSKLQ